MLNLGGFRGGHWLAQQPARCSHSASSLPLLEMTCLGKRTFPSAGGVRYNALMVLLEMGS